MKARRTILLAVGALMLTGVALGAGVALGSSRDADPPKASTPTGSVPAKAKPVKCKANACVHWSSSGSMIGAHPGVVDVANTGTGVYCVELSSKLAASAETIAQATVDYNNGTPGKANIALIHTNATPCLSNGIEVLTYNGDGTTNWTLTNDAVFFSLP